MKGKRIVLLVFAVVCLKSVRAEQIRHQISALGTTPVSFRIPIPTFGLSYDLLVWEHLSLGLGINGSTALFPINGLDGGSSHGSLNASLSVILGRIGIGAKYFTQANSFFFTAYTDDSSRTKLGAINHTGRQDYLVLLISLKVTDRLTVFGGPGFETLRNNDYGNTAAPGVLQDSALSAQWQAKMPEYEAAYNNFLDRYKVYLGISIRFLDL